MDEYKDITRNNVGANWISRVAANSWTKPGGDFHSAEDATNTTIMYSATLENGTEDIEVDVTTLIEEWIDGTHPDGYTTMANYGFGVHLTSSHEAYFSSSYPDGTGGQDYPALSGGILHNLAGATTSYYTKKFSARGSEYFFKRPTLEARWDSAKKDNRANFHYSSSLALPHENINTLYFYNYYRGQLRNIPDPATGNQGPNGKIFVSLFSGSANNTAPDGATRENANAALQLVADGTHVTVTADPTIVTGTWVETGVYKASFAATGTLTRMFDVWFVTSSVGQTHYSGIQVHTGAIDPITLAGSTTAPGSRKVNSITNLKDAYSTEETARFRIFTREKNWNPTIYSRAQAAPKTDIIESGSFRIYRIIDDLSVIPYGTSSATLHTQMSFDESGSYFDLDMNMLEPGYAYAIKLAYYNGSIGTWAEQPETFKFRVEKWV